MGPKFRMFQALAVYLLVLAGFFSNVNTLLATFCNCKPSSCSKSAMSKISFSPTKISQFSLIFLGTLWESKQWMLRKKHRPTNVGRIALGRKAGGKPFDPTGIRNIDVPLHYHMYYRLCYFALIFGMLQTSLY